MSPGLGPVDAPAITQAQSTAVVGWSFNVIVPTSLRKTRTQYTGTERTRHRQLQERTGKRRRFGRSDSFR